MENASDALIMSANVLIFLIALTVCISSFSMFREDIDNLLDETEVVQMAKNGDEYLNYMGENPTVGYLKVRAYAANQAVPINNLKIVVSKKIGNNNVIFFEGYTDQSGTIEKITLPTKRLNLSNMDVPKSTTYEITATYQEDNDIKIYEVRIYENIYVIQNINIVPNTSFDLRRL